MLETLMNGYFRNAVRFIVHVICHIVIFYYIEKDRPFIFIYSLSSACVRIFVSPKCFSDHRHRPFLDSKKS